MKLNVGDRVRVINTAVNCKEALYETGVIAEILEDYPSPYHIIYDKEDLNIRAEYSFFQDLFKSSDLELMSEPKIDETSYINIKFQEGTVAEVGVNGCQIEDVVNMLVERLEGFQKGGFPCHENAMAIMKLQEARMWLNERTRKREKQGVEGKYEKHE